MRHPFACLILTAALAVAPPVVAGELLGGVFAQGVDTPLSKDIGEGGVALQAGWRGGRIAALGGATPHVFVSASTAGDTSFAVAGLGWRLGTRVYLRPALGLAIHDGPSRRVRDGFRVDLGSRVLFAPELAAGVRLGERLSVEAAWVHLSHGQLFSSQNPGLDTVGIRLAWRD